MSDGAAAREQVQLRLPATSANLGPGFDALGLALNFHLHVTAIAADPPRLQVTGRDAGTILRGNRNLILETVREVLEAGGKPVPQLDMHIRNEIPLGMGCGSSAAALVAGVALANHFGGLRWNAREVLAMAAAREGHPDNVAACVLGGFTASASRSEGVDAIALQPPIPWQVLLVLPGDALETKAARALLPLNYSREDAVANVQNVALLTAAFATGQEALLREAMRDRMHQPYRAVVCPLLTKLLPLAAEPTILGVALSGAGPSVLLLAGASVPRSEVEKLVLSAVGKAEQNVELLWTQIAGPAVLG